MADSTQLPPAWPGDEPARAGVASGTVRRVTAAVLLLAAVVAGSALLGLLAGVVWAGVAPHVLVVTAPGGPDLANVETTAFIVADGWFAAICAVGGAICGLLGWLAAVRRAGPLAVVGLLAGGALAGFVARWAGQRSGRVTFAHQLAASKPGALLHAPLMLGAAGAIAFWPLAAALVVASIEGAALLRQRRAERYQPARRRA